MFKTEQLGMQALVEMIEKEFPETIWGVGRCPCKEHPGAYVASIQTEDFTIVGFALTADGPKPIHQGWAVHAHGSTWEEALGNAYGQALERGESA